MPHYMDTWAELIKNGVLPNLINVYIPKHPISPKLFNSISKLSIEELEFCYANEAMVRDQWPPTWTLSMVSFTVQECAPGANWLLANATMRIDSRFTIIRDLIVKPVITNDVRAFTSLSTAHTFEFKINGNVMISSLPTSLRVLDLTVLGEDTVSSTGYWDTKLIALTNLKTLSIDGLANCDTLHIYPTNLMSLTIKNAPSLFMINSVAMPTISHLEIHNAPSLNDVRLSSTNIILNNTGMSMTTVCMILGVEASIAPRIAIYNQIWEMIDSNCLSDTPIEKFILSNNSFVNMPPTLDAIIDAMVPISDSLSSLTLEGFPPHLISAVEIFQLLSNQGISPHLSVLEIRDIPNLMDDRTLRDGFLSSFPLL